MHLSLTREAAESRSHQRDTPCVVEVLAAKAHALLNGQNHVGCSNVAAVAPPIFRHRLIPNFAAQSEGLDSDAITAKIIEAIPQH